MSKEQSNTIEYLVSCIGAFAERFSLTNGEAYSYMNAYQGLAFLLRHYDVEHTLSIDDSIQDVTAICLRNGGYLKW